jgi:hypothetical protein
MNIETQQPQLEAILAPFKATIGQDYEGYRNHLIRMLNFCFYLANQKGMLSEDAKEKFIIAAAFHDIGIWTNGTVDYLPPSEREAEKYLKEVGKEEWMEEIILMISEHHKLRAYKNEQYPLVEVFRQADLVDFSLGMVRKGIPKEFVMPVKNEIPNAGFHRLLMKLSWRQLKKHPLNPAPMMKW